jgi:beta-glucanase (GH16 family)
MCTALFYSTLYSQQVTICASGTGQPGGSNLTNPIYITGWNHTCNWDPYYLVFEDLFDGNEVNKSVWDHHYKWANTLCCENESQLYVEGNRSVDNGTLHLYADDQQVWGKMKEWLADNVIVEDGLPNGRFFDYSSGMVATDKKFGYGKYEIICKIPKGKGFWPAFWTFGAEKGNQNWNEIDGFEFWNEESYVVGQGWQYDASKLAKIPNLNSHFNINGDNWAFNCGTKHETGVDYSTSMHKFTFIYDPYKIQYFIDDVLVRITYQLFRDVGTSFDPVECYELNLNNQGTGYRVNRAFPQHPGSHIIANLAIQAWSDLPDASTNFSSEYEIESIRYYKQLSCVPNIVCNNNSEAGITLDQFDVLVGNNVTLQNNVYLQEQWSGSKPYRGQLDVVAKNSIQLLPGFFVDQGSSFKATINTGLWACKSNENVTGTNRDSEAPFEYINIDEENNLPSSNSFEFTIYPNPTSNEVTIRSLEEESNLDVQITDITGKVVYSGEMRNSRQIVWDSNQVRSGTYLVTLYDPQTSQKKTKLLIVN